MAIAAYISVQFNLVTSESFSLKHMLERSGLPDVLTLTNNALAWYKIYRDTKAASRHMIAKNPETGCHYFIADSVRAGDKVRRQSLILSTDGVEKISFNFMNGEQQKKAISLVLNDAFYVLDQIITAQKKGLVISSMNGKTQTYEALMLHLMQP